MSPGHLSARVHDLFEALRHFPDHLTARKILMNALAHLTAAVEKSAEQLKAKDAQIADLQAQLDAKAATPATGATDDQLDDLTSKLEAIIGAVTDPDASGSTGGTGPQPVVGATSTTVTGADGSTTTVDHATGTAATTDATGAPVATDQSAAAAATQAAQAAGVAVPIA